MVTGRRNALIVACADYQDPGLQRLRAPTQDAEALASVLKDPRIGAFDVRTLVNEPAYVVSEGVEEFFAERGPEDLLLLHFSCHGVKDESGELYFAASNTKLTRLGATGVAAEFVSRRMNRSRSRRIILFLDCCYAGAFERGMAHRADTGMNLQEQLTGRGRAVITASSSMEYSFESGELANSSTDGPSVFTGALVDGLATGEADRNQDGMITLDELYDYVYGKVRTSSPNQTPGKWVFGVQGDLHIARRIRRLSEPTPLSVELEQLIDHPIPSVRMTAVEELQKLRKGRHLGLAESAERVLQKLAKDDSRRVASAASVALREQVRLPVLPSADPETARPQPSEPKHDSAPSTSPKPTRPHSPPNAFPRPPRPDRVGPVDAAAEAKPTSSHPKPANPVPAPVPASERPRRTQERTTQSALGATDVTPTRATEALLRRSAGALTVLAALLMASNPFIPYVQYSDETLLDVGSHAVLPALGTAVLVGIAGVCLCGPSKNWLLGAGMLLGESATLPWFLWNQWEPRSMWGPATWIWYVALWMLVVAAGVAGVAAFQCRGAALRWRTTLSARSWALPAIGVASAVVLAAERFAVVEYRVSSENWGILVWVLMALVVPVCISVASPDRFAISLAVGWAGAAAIAMYYSAYSARQWGIESQLPIVFVALMAVLVATTVASSSHPIRPDRRRV